MIRCTAFGNIKNMNEIQNFYSRNFGSNDNNGAIITPVKPPKMSQQKCEFNDAEI